MSIYMPWEDSRPGTVVMDITQIRGDNNMLSQLRPALVSLGIFTILTGWSTRWS